MSQRYSKLTDVEHVLHRPAMYAGSTNLERAEMHLFDNDTQSIRLKPIEYVPALYKIFDEVLVNAVDHAVRTITDKSYSKKDQVSMISVEINQEEGWVSVANDGKAIDVVMHKKEQVYVPELVFGNLRTSENFDDSKTRIVGGLHGLGSKLTNIFSKKFIVDIRDSRQQKRYYQVFEKNMSKKKEPIIKDSNKSDMVKITFYPDFERFGVKGFTDDMVALMKKRVYDMSACTRWLSAINKRSIKIKYNKHDIEVKTFDDYMNLYIGEELPRVFEAVNENWDVGVCFSDTGFQQVSFVNSIYTSQGGRHVDYIVNQMVDKLFDTLSKKNKDITLKKPFIKNNMMVFIRCNINNPEFNSQTKETLTTAQSKFGTEAILKPSFIKKVGDLGISEEALKLAEFKEQKQLSKTDGKKSKRVLIPKYQPANWAGTSKSGKCTLIVTEGDSALNFAVSALSKKDRDIYGLFPLKGKPLNVRDQTVKKLMANEEFNNLKQILGLETGKKYTDAKSLRYGHLMVMADQDNDGYHIKSLVFNVFSVLWPSLFQLDDFLISFQTPILKAVKGNKKLIFFTETDFERWQKRTPDHKTWKTKYLKGLGSSTATEAKEYFQNPEKHLLKYKYTREADKSFQLAFDKKKADDRKKWLMQYDREEILEPENNIVAMDDVIHRELIHFSNADTARSIPSMIDGLKPSQRKVLFAAFKRNLRQEIKVSQFAGYISENAAYHHGEKSLEDSIVNLARDFVGTNNINLLMPNGMFGNRNNPNGAASARYIFTALNPLTFKIFDPRDMPLLEYLNDDGQSIEPLYYVPIIPMSLVNGVKGIGTGFSTTIPNYNPKDIIENLKLLLDGKPLKTLVPWYKDFDGVITRTSSQGYDTIGKYSVHENQVHITELPIQTWTESYMDYLKTLVIDRKNSNKVQVITDIQNRNTDSEVDMLLTFEPKALQQLIKENKLDKLLKMTTKLSVANMHLFNEEGAIQKYSSVNQIIKQFFDIRMNFYEKRKKYMVDVLEHDIALLNAKVAYILAILEDKINMKKMDENKVIEYLTKEKYPEDNGSFNYLLNLATRYLTKDNVEKLKKQLSDKQKELDILKSKTIKDLYIEDLTELEKLL